MVNPHPALSDVEFIFSELASNAWLMEKSDCNSLTFLCVCSWVKSHGCAAVLLCNFILNCSTCQQTCFDSSQIEILERLRLCSSDILYFAQRLTGHINCTGFRVHFLDPRLARLFGKIWYNSHYDCRRDFMRLESSQNPVRSWEQSGHVLKLQLEGEKVNPKQRSEMCMFVLIFKIEVY